LRKTYYEKNQNALSLNDSLSSIYYPSKANCKIFSKKFKKKLTFAFGITILNNPPLMAGNKIFDILREGSK
jgi:hypothetical protein